MFSNFDQHPEKHCIQVYIQVVNITWKRKTQDFGTTPVQMIPTKKQERI